MSHETHTHHPQLPNQEHTSSSVCDKEMVHAVELAAWLSEHQKIGGKSGGPWPPPPPPTSSPYVHHPLYPTVSYLTLASYSSLVSFFLLLFYLLQPSHLHIYHPLHPTLPYFTLGHYKLDNSFPSTARMPLTSPPIFIIIVVIFYYNKL